MSLLRVQCHPMVRAEGCGLQHQCIALIRARGLWESDNWFWTLQIHITAHTAAAEEFFQPAFSPPSPPAAEHLPHRIPPEQHPPSCCIPSLSAAFPFVSLPALALPLDLQGGGGGSLLRGWEAPLCPAWLWAPQKADAKHGRAGGLVPSLTGRLRRGSSESPTQWHSKGEHHQPGLEAAPLMAPGAAITNMHLSFSVVKKCQGTT